MPASGKPGVRGPGRPSVERSVEARVVDACAEDWLAKQPKEALALKAVKIPKVGTADLFLIAPKKGTLVVVARSWPHAAAFAHVVGHAVGTIAHLMDTVPTDARALVQGTERGLDPSRARWVGTRLMADAAAGDLGIVFAIGYTDRDGDDPVRTRLVPVLSLLHRWADLGVPGLKLGVFLWSIRLGEASFQIESVALDKPSSGDKAREEKR